MAVTHATAMRNAMAELVADCDSGSLEFRITGSTANNSVTAVATLPLNATAFDVAGTTLAGKIVANAITSDTNAVGGVIAFAAIKTFGGAINAHCSVAAVSGGDINISSGGLTVTAGDTVSCSSLTYTAPV